MTMGQTASAKLATGLSFDTGALDLVKLARHLGVEPLNGDGSDPSDVIDDLGYEIEKKLPAGLKLSHRSTWEGDEWVLGTEPLRVGWGRALKVDALPTLTEEQTAELLKLQQAVGGEKGTWLFPLFG